MRKLTVLMLPMLLVLAPLTMAPLTDAAAQTTTRNPSAAKPSAAKPSATKMSAKAKAQKPARPVAPQQDQSYFDAGPVGPSGGRQDYLGTGANSGSIPFRGSMVGGSAGSFPSSFGLDPNPAMR